MRRSSLRSTPLTEWRLSQAHCNGVKLRQTAAIDAGRSGLSLLGTDVVRSWTSSSTRITDRGRGGGAGRCSAGALFDTVMASTGSASSGMRFDPEGELRGRRHSCSRYGLHPDDVVEQVNRP